MEDILTIASIDSTNNYLRKQLEQKNDLPEGFTVRAIDQTAGRGQIGNCWEVEAGANLTFSILLYPTFVEPQNQFILSQAIALAIVTLLQEYAPDEKEHFSIKWPNDIYWKNKKICGILIENLLMGNHISDSIIGIGLNINQKEFPKHLPNPISLSLITGQTYNLEEVLQKLRGKIQRFYREIAEQPASIIQARYLAHLYRLGVIANYSDEKGKFKATLLNVAPDGRIMMEDEQGQLRTYMFKEVSFEN